MRNKLTLSLCGLALVAALVFAFQGRPIPAGGGGTPVYVPLVVQIIPPTDTPTATATATSTSTATSTATRTQPPQPASLHITTLSGTTTPEFVEITNSGGVVQPMTGWTLVSVVGPQTFTFPVGYMLGAGATVRVESYTGAGDNPPAVLFWTNSEMWANDGDKAELRDVSNGLVDSECYGDACP